MAGEHAFTRYEYRPNSNLVLSMERDSRAASEPSGEVESLREHLVGRFGDRARRGEAKELQEKKEKARKKREAKERREESMRSRREESGVSVLNYGEQEGFRYAPKTKQTREAFDRLLSAVGKYLGDVPPDVLRGAADEALAILKEDGAQDAHRKSQIHDILDTEMEDEEFAALIAMSKAITDYEIEQPKDDDDKQEELDEDLGVRVVVDEDDEESELSDLDEVDEGYDPDDLDESKVDTPLGEQIKADQFVMQDDDEEMLDKDRVSVSDIDAYWLQRLLAKHHSDASDAQQEAEEVMALLEEKSDDRLCENKLVQLLKHDRFDEIRLFLKNRWRIVCCTKLSRADDESRQALEEALSKDPNMRAVLMEMSESKGLRMKSQALEQTLLREARELRRQHEAASGGPSLASGFKALELETLAFKQGGHLMTNKKLTLPEGSFRQTNKEGGYEEVHVPAVKPTPKAGEIRLPIADMPEWARAAFPKTDSLNRMQTRCYKTAMFSAENLLLCAPTAAGKTNVAMLTILRELGVHRSERTGRINLDAFKIVYIAPMKALVQEVVRNFGDRLQPYGIVVRELTGDAQLTKQQISETQIIVTTPEKWDIITRKSGDRTYTSLVKLLIFDEIHLLHDSRGPVLEAIVARTIRQIQTTQEMIRLVGLSATLPNYGDVAAFLRVSADTGLFVFDNSYRPVGLQQQYIGITEKKAIKRYQIMNNLTYEKVLAQQAGEKPQVIVFVHSRKDTAKTARALRDTALQSGTLGHFLREDSASREILQADAESAKNSDLKDLLPYGFAVHHAGLSKYDRKIVEDLFRDRHIPVLVSTATLAWGVNLPAHTVIIKGTQIYDPEKSAWVELSSLDVMQMLGRAGRPQFDDKGEGIVITSHKELHFYLSLLNEKLPIESQLISRLPDMLLAEVVLGTVNNLKEGVDWLGYTYLFVRMLHNPELYGSSQDELRKDKLLEKRRGDLIHSAALVLDKANLVRYDHRSGNFQVTELGRVSAHYYISHQTMTTFNEHLKPTMSDIDVFRLFSLAGEFQYMRVREDEKVELQKMLDRAPIPVKESIEETSAKVNVLLQSYISQLRLDGLALVADMVYVTQSAGRLVRALFEIALKRGWASLAEKLLDLCKMIDRRMWRSQSPLYQFKDKGVPEESIKRLEKKNFEFSRLYDLSPQELGELVSVPQLGRKLRQMIVQFPKMELTGHVQPITRSILRVELTITADFQMDEKVHGQTEPFWLLVEDVDSELILHHEQFLLKRKYAEDDHVVSFFVPLMEPLPPQYFVRLVSDRWLHAETVLPISFRHLILPEKYPPRTELLDLQPLPVSALRNEQFESLYKQWGTFNPIQTQVFMSLYNTDDNVLIAAPTGSGKTVCAEFAMLRLFGNEGYHRVVYVTTLEDIAQVTLKHWQRTFGKVLGKSVVALTGETATDLKLLENSDIIVATAEKWDMMSRRWKQRRNVQNVDLFIVDELHLIGVEQGPVLEVVVSRMRNIASQTDKPIRIVALSTSLANAKDLGEWIGAPASATFNFHPDVRPVPLETHLRGFDIPHMPTRILAMGKPTYHAISTHTSEPDLKGGARPAIVFVSSRKLARVTAVDMLTFAASDNTPNKFLKCDEKDIEPLLESFKDRALRECCARGVGYLHEGLSEHERATVEHLFQSGALQVLVVNHTLCWALAARAHLVVVMGTQYYHGREHRYADYSVSKLLQMLGHANRPLVDECGKAVVMCLGSKKEFFKRFLFEPLPCESHLDHALRDHMCAEIVTKTVENKQDAVDYLTWTYFYRRLTQNPNYYNLQGVSYSHLSEHLSELVETTIADLEQCRAIAVQNDSDLVPLNLGIIASYYYISCTTIELFSRSLTDRTKLKGLVEILASATEFDDIPIRLHEDDVLRRIGGHVPMKLEKPKYTEPSTKVNILLQAHFTRLSIPDLTSSLSAELQDDQREILGVASRLVLAMVDVISSSRWLSPALACMELSQMTVQGVWDKDPVLMQVPHITREVAAQCAKAGVEGVFDLIELEDDKRRELVGLQASQLADVARWCNRYPDIECSYQVEDADDIHAGDEVTIVVSLERNMGEDEALPPVYAPRYPKRKDEGWWLVVGDTATKRLLGIKRVPLQQQATVKLEFEAPEEGKHTVTMFFMCDSYLGCDQEYEIELDVKEGQESSEEDDESMEDDDEGEDEGKGGE